MKSSAIADLENKPRTAAVARLGLDERTGALALLALGAGVLLSRLPFQASLLSNFDAINYALALAHFDMRLAQPQAPGYPLFILLARAFNLVLHDPRLALNWLSMVSSALAAVAITLAGSAMFNRRAGLAAAMLLAASTVVWYMSEIAAPYALDLFFSALVGWLCWRALEDPGPGPVWAAALALGLAGAQRPQDLVFLFPLFLYALNRRSWKTILGATALAGAVFALFFIPAVMVSGGFGSFRRAMVGILPVFRDVETLARSTRFERFLTNTRTIVRYTARALGELSLPFALLGPLAFRRDAGPWRQSRPLFLLLWALPTWIVYFLIWPGNLGTILVSLPPFFLLVAAGLDVLLAKPGWKRALGWAALAAVLAWSVLVFAVLPERPFGRAYRTFDNYASLQESVSYYREKLALVEQIPVQGTVVVAGDFRHMQYYLPEYHTLSMPEFSPKDPQTVSLLLSIEGGRWSGRRDFPASEIIPPGTQRVVFFDRPRGLEIDERLAAQEKSMGGVSIWVIELSPGMQIHWSPDGLFSGG